MTDYSALYERFGELIVAQTGMTDSPFGEGASDDEIAALGFPVPDDYALLLSLTGKEVDPSLITFPPEEISLLTIDQVVVRPDGGIAIARTRDGRDLLLMKGGLVLDGVVVAESVSDLIAKIVRGLESGALRIVPGFTFVLNGDPVGREAFATL